MNIITVKTHNELPDWTHRYVDENGETQEANIADAVRRWRLRYPGAKPPIVVWRFQNYTCIAEPSQNDYQTLSDRSEP